MHASDTGSQPSGLKLSQVPSAPEVDYDCDPPHPDGHSGEDSMTFRDEMYEKLMEFVQGHGIPLSSLHKLNKWDLLRNKGGSAQVCDLGLDPMVQNDLMKIQQLQVEFKRKKWGRCNDMMAACSQEEFKPIKSVGAPKGGSPIQDKLYDLQSTVEWQLLGDDLNNMLLKLGKDIFTQIGERALAYPLPDECSKGLVMHMEKEQNAIPVFLQKAGLAYMKGERRQCHFDVADNLVTLGFITWCGEAATKGHKPTKTAICETMLDLNELHGDHDWAKWWLQVVCNFQEHVLQY
jgi:hypothetical protein